MLPTDDGSGGASEHAAAAGLARTERAYGSGASTYYYQVERFVKDVSALLWPDEIEPSLRERVRADMQADAQQCVANMQLIDDIYEAASLPLRLPTPAE